MTNPVDVLLIGAGMVGVATARALARYGVKTVVLRHPAPASEGWRAAAGMLAAQVEAAPESPLFELALAGRAFYRKQAEVLLADTGIDIGYHAPGILQVVRSEAGISRAKAKVAWQRQRAWRAEWLEPIEVAERFPWLDPGMGGYWASEDGQVSPERAHAALLADAQRLGAQVIDEVVTGLRHDGRRLQGVETLSGRQYTAGIVVVANGAWAGQIANLPRPISVAPVYGRVSVHPWPEAIPPAIVYGEGCYLLHRDNQLIAGGTMEHPGFVPRDEPGPLEQMYQRLRTLYPGFDRLERGQVYSGFRPGTPDGLPIIGPEPRVSGLWYATGHGRNGILLAGITGEVVARGITGQDWPEDLRPMAPERFWSWAVPQS